MLSMFCALPAVAQQEKKSRIVDIEGLVIEGEIQRPEAFFILQRDEQDILSTLTLDPLEDVEKKIEEGARSALFK
jgi:hypothetical protein